MQAEILKYLGFDPEKIKSVEDFKKVFEPEFVRPSAFKETEAYKALHGELLGAAAGKIKNAFKNAGIEFEAGEIKDKPYHDILSIGFGKLNESHTAKIKELEGKAGQGSEEAKKEWADKYEKLHKKHQETENLLKQTAEEFEKTKSNHAAEIKGINIDNFKKSVKEKIPLLSTAHPLTIKGFHDTLEENYLIDFDEDGKTPIVKNSKGERIKSETVTGKFKTFEEVYADEAKKENLLQINKPGTGTPAKTVSFGTELGAGQTQAKEPFVHPNARV